MDLIQRGVAAGWRSGLQVGAKIVGGVLVADSEYMQCYPELEMDKDVDTCLQVCSVARWRSCELAECLACAADETGGPSTHLSARLSLPLERILKYFISV